jgi:hypothetical protein
MSPLKIALQKFLKNISKQNIIELKPAIIVELTVELSFETFCQVSYTNEKGDYCIREFSGKFWSKKIHVSIERELLFSVFVNNHLLLKNQTLVITKLVDDKVVSQQKILIDATSPYSGWYKLK